jgi:hypothetical protein
MRHHLVVALSIGYIRHNSPFTHLARFAAAAEDHSGCLPRGMAEERL